MAWDEKYVDSGSCKAADPFPAAVAPTAGKDDSSEQPAVCVSHADSQLAVLQLLLNSMCAYTGNRFE